MTTSDPYPASVDRERAGGILAICILAVLVSCFARLLNFGWFTLMYLPLPGLLFAVTRWLMVRTARQPPGADRLMSVLAHLSCALWTLGFVLFPDGGDAPPTTAVFGLYEDPPEMLGWAGMGAAALGFLLDVAYGLRASYRQSARQR